MIALNIPQGSLDWITARLWRLTASEMTSVITATGKLSKSEAAMGSIDKLIAGIDLANEIQRRQAEIADLDEWKLKAFMSHYTGEKFTGNRHTNRGHESEADAIAALSEKVGMQITDIGMCVMGDQENGVVSCSPDGLIYEGKTLISGAEVKAPCLAKYYGHAADRVLPSEYRMQVHGSMAVCQVGTWHFASFFPGKPIFHVEVRRDAFTDTVERALIEFRDIYAARFEAVSNAVSALGKEAA